MDAFLRRVHEQREREQREDDERADMEAAAQRAAKARRRKLIAESAARHSDVFRAIHDRRQQETEDLTASMIDGEADPVAEAAREEERAP